LQNIFPVFVDYELPLHSENPYFMILIYDNDP